MAGLGGVRSLGEELRVIAESREWGGQVPQTLTQVALGGHAHHWPALEWQGCSAWEVTISLSLRHSQEIEGQS